MSENMNTPLTPMERFDKLWDAVSPDADGYAYIGRVTDLAGREVSVVVAATNEEREAHDNPDQTTRTIGCLVGGWLDISIDESTVEKAGHTPGVKESIRDLADFVYRTMS